MTITFREEIHKILDSDNAYNFFETLDIDYCIDHILKIFEKLIDSTLENIKRDVEFISESDLKYQPNLDIQLHHIYNLKEMLK